MAMINEFLDPSTVALLVEHYAGCRLTVPAEDQGKAWERLVSQLGEDHARCVVRWFSGETIAVPMAADERPEQTIRDLREAGMPICEIAKVSFIRRFSERQIYRILAV